MAPQPLKMIIIIIVMVMTMIMIIIMLMRIEKYIFGKRLQVSGRSSKSRKRPGVGQMFITVIIVISIVFIHH